MLCCYACGYTVQEGTKQCAKCGSSHFERCCPHATADPPPDAWHKEQEWAAHEFRVDAHAMGKAG